MVASLGGALLAGPPAAAQPAAPDTHCLLLPLDPARRAARATLVAEAEVLDAQGFWDAGHRRIFTRHRLRVFSGLKGAVPDTLTLITEGGQVGLDKQVLTNTLRLTAGRQGLFFLVPAPWPGLPATPTAWAAYGSEQGFIGYNLTDGSATEPFRRYPAVNAAFYQAISAATGQARRVRQPNPALAAALAPKTLAAKGAGTTAAVITGFSPARVPAGADDVLTIEGQGFGTSRGSGYVEFKNADDGGATWVRPRAADYLAWSDTRIRVRVPSNSDTDSHPAGSGPVRVSSDGQLATESPTAVVIPYALTNVASTTGSIVRRPNHIALNGSGGVSFRFGPNFVANAAASAAWQRALTSWRCQTGMNWDVATTAPTNSIADDDQNVIAFDTPADELPERVLGRTTSYYQGCFAPTGEVIFYVQEVDMQFDAEVNFQFGPAPAVGAQQQLDFETVALHELGHAQQLNHLILPGAVMHYAVARGQNTRRLSLTSEVTGGRRVLRELSFRPQGCGGLPLLPAPLTSFAVPAANVPTFRWTTRDECNLLSFVIERSLGGDTTAWQVLATQGPGNATGTYTFTDPQPAPGLRYYRIGLVRADGSRDYAAPQLVNTGSITAAALFPNPVVGNDLYFQYPAAATGTLTLRIVDAVGRALRRSSGLVSPGLNVLPVGTDGLRPGLYILRWTDGQGQEGSQKFVKQ